MPRIVFFTIHRTTPWWTYLASRIDFADVTVLSDLRGEGDYSLVDDFYRFMRKGDATAAALARLGEDGADHRSGDVAHRRVVPSGGGP